jgi:hypothetical protein
MVGSLRVDWTWWKDREWEGGKKIGTVVRVVGGSEYQDDMDSEMVMANEGKS